MYKGILMAVMVFMVALTVAQGAVTDTDEIRFYHEVRADNTVQFRWRPEIWKTDQIGFRLERRDGQSASGGDGEPVWGKWSIVGPEVIEPDLTGRRLKRDNLEKVLEAQREGFDSDKLSPPEIIEKFTTQPEEFKKVKSLCAKHQDWNLAFALGWRDEWAPDRLGRKAQYRLQRVLRVGGQIELEKAAETEVCFDPDVWEVPEVIAFEVYRPGKKQDNATAVWQVPEQAYDQHPNIQGYVLLQGEVDGPLDHKLGFFPRSIWGEVEDGIRTVTYSAGRPGDGRYQYGLAPRNMFGTVGPVMYQATLESKPARLIPAFASRFERTDAGVLLRWSHKQPEGTRFAGYRVMRKLPKDVTFVAVNDEFIPPSARQYVDTSLPDLGEEQLVKYRIDIVTGDRRPVREGTVGEYRTPLNMPEAPKDFTATFKKIEDQWHVVCSWTPVQSSGITGYNVERYSTDSEQWHLEWSGIKESTGNTFRVLGVRADTKWKLRVRAVNKDGEEGPPSKPVIAETKATKVKVPMPTVQARAAEEKAQAESDIVRRFEKVRHFGNDPKVVGSITQVAELTNGETARHGASIRYYQDPAGQKMIETYYVRGERHGLRRSWGKDGELASLKAYVDGERLDQSEIPQSPFADQLTAADRFWLEANSD